MCGENHPQQRNPTAQHQSSSENSPLYSYYFVPLTHAKTKRRHAPMKASKQSRPFTRASSRRYRIALRHTILQIYTNDSIKPAPL